jgi:hypothetical protein
MLQYRFLPVLAACLFFGNAGAQELFVLAEPASNMPTHSVGVRLSNWLMNEPATGKVNYHFIPELMWGANKNLMVHVEGFISNRTDALSLEGGGIYAKYRFFSHDEVYRHFRMAVFGRASVNNADIHQEEIQTNGHNSGYQLGIIGTQLLHKTALSVTGYYHQAVDNQNGNELPVTTNGTAFSYSLSAGRLVLPKTYKSYKQVNMNIMLEALGEVLPQNAKQYFDLAPSIQFIFNSQTRVDISYRHELYSNMTRTAPNGFIFRVEHLLFNVI